jgi:hypothetical protein
LGRKDAKTPRKPTFVHTLDAETETGLSLPGAELLLPVGAIVPRRVWSSWRLGVLAATIVLD